MKSIKQNLQDQGGFIAIMALGIFALLTVFVVTVQVALNDTVNSVKNANNYHRARDIADSAVEYLQFLASKNGPGFNTNDMICNFKNGVFEGGGRI